MSLPAPDGIQIVEVTVVRSLSRSAAAWFTSVGIHVAAAALLCMTTSVWLASVQPGHIDLQATMAEEVEVSTEITTWVEPEINAAQPVSVQRQTVESESQPEEREVLVPESTVPVAVANRVETPTESTPQPVSANTSTPPRIRSQVVPALTRTAHVPARTVPATFVGANAPTPPRPIFNPSPSYPAAELAARITGRVVFLVTIDEQGRVVSVVIDRSSGYVALDNAARVAVLRWKFERASTLLVAKREVRVPVNFRIAD